MIPHNKPTIGKEEIGAVTRVLRSGWIAEGEKVKEFEHAVCRYLRMPTGCAVALGSGTAALYLALLALDVKKGGEVIVPTYVCSAVLNAVHMAAAAPVLADIDPHDLNISFEGVKKKINRRTSAIIITHTFGMPSDVERFRTLGLPIIEDCAQAIGAKMDGTPIGTKGTVSIFSFYASKMLTTGYGGMLISRDKRLIRRALDYREFDGRREYTPRFNFQLSDMQAALGEVQLKRLPSFLKRRKRIATMYREALPAGIELWPKETPGRRANFYRIVLRTKHAARLKKFLAARGIRTIVPIERFELLHRYLGENPKQFPVSEKVVKETLSLPAYPSLTNAEVHTICAALQEFFRVP